MARPKSTGVNPVIRRRKDKSIVKVDYYHRASGLHLGNDETEAHAKARELDGEVPRQALPVTVFEGLVADYLASERFLTMAEQSRTTNRHYVERLATDFAGLQVVGITRPVVQEYRKTLFRKIREAELVVGKKPVRRKGEFGPMTPYVAKHLLNKLVLLLTHAADCGVITANPAYELRAAFGIRPRDDRWSPPEIRAFLKQSTGPLRLGFALLLFTAQRLGDVLAMTWEQVEDRADGLTWATVEAQPIPEGRGKMATLRQKKTGALVSFPIHRDLRTILHEVPVKDRHGLIVHSPRKKVAWSRRNFSRKWDACETKIGLDASSLQRRDLRRTAMSFMSIAGATDQQVAAVSGHSIEQTRQILSTYIPRLGEIAAGGIAAWERMPSILIETDEDAPWAALHNPLQNPEIVQQAAE